MKVDVSRHYELYSEDSKRLLGKDAPIGFPAMAVAAVFITIFLFVVGFIPSVYLVLNGDMSGCFGIGLWVFILFLSLYLTYDVFGNYLYYKGIWKDPPFAKRSVKVFWRDLKRGKIKALVLWGGGRESLDFHIIYKALGNRGVVVKISKEEKLGLDKFLEERVKRGAKRVRFEFEGLRVKDAIIEYVDGCKERVGKDKAELMRFFYAISENKFASAGLYASKVMRKLVEGKKLSR